MADSGSTGRGTAAASVGGVGAPKFVLILIDIHNLIINSNNYGNYQFGNNNYGNYQYSTIDNNY